MAKNKKIDNKVVCLKCGTKNAVTAKYCSNCGTQINKAIDSQIPKLKIFLLLSVIMFVSIAGSLGIFIGFNNDSGKGTVLDKNLQRSQSSIQKARPPDLSKMTPREAADRLFNRVMAASERGNINEARRFAPMAVQAYELIENINLDGLFHLGLMNLIMENKKDVMSFAERIKNKIPNHLLALFLEYKVAVLLQDARQKNEIGRIFLKSYPEEIKIDREEYVAHRIPIEDLRRTLKTVNNNKQSLKEKVSAESGSSLFLKNCSMCHGKYAQGSKMGPPLVHKVYEPSHHDDASFYRAVDQGVEAHHWSFGNMPAIKISRDKVTKIIQYIRDLQLAAGIK
ncbi:MAG: c-type cytochrome [Rhodospirillaceae bacterium]|nr:c-type cytochrome [Rhodospirillaceae bacterium]